MQDVNGKQIGGYRYGPYYFGVNGHDRISALCGESYAHENELLSAYDSVQGDHSGAPILTREYNDGTSVQLRPRQAESK